MFTAALFIIAKTWKEPRCSLVGLIKEIVIQLDNGILFNAKRKCGIMPQKIWGNLKMYIIKQKIPI
jgi:hypothetical protein